MNSFDKELIKIKRTFYSGQNGVVSRNMTEAGIRYPLNYGLSIFDIKEIATGYQPDNEFAWFLFGTNIREAKLLSFYLFEESKVHKYELIKISNAIDNTELAEQFVSNFLQKIPFASQLIIPLCQSSNPFVKMTGFLLMARLSLMTKSVLPATEDMEEVIWTEAFKADMVTARSISLAIRQYGSVNKEIKLKMLNLISKLRESENNASKWIAEESSLEIFPE